VARTIETEVVDMEATLRAQAVENKAGDGKPKSGSNTTSRKVSRWILLLVSAIAVAGASLWWQKERAKK